MKIYYPVLLVMLMLLATPALASSDLSVTETLQNIITAQDLSRIQDIDCDQVTDQQFEQLGDAFMEQIHPGEQHEWMDTMMGGEGSDSLTAMHVAMGQNYLGCNGYHYAQIGSRMMGPGIMSGGFLSQGMMGANFYYPNNLTTKNQFTIMSGYQWFWFIHLATIALIWITLILAIISLIKWLKVKK